MTTLASFLEYGNVASLTFCAVVLLASLAIWSMTRPQGFPPGPIGLPFLGSVLSMTASPEEVFERWSKRYGDVFGFKAGERLIVVINHGDAIREALIKHGIEFAGRPDFFSFKVFTYGFKDIIFSSYSDTWRLHHKFAHSALRHYASGKRLEELLHGSILKMKGYLAKMDEEEPLDPKLVITLLLYNVMSTMCFGKDYDFLDKNLIAWKENNEKLNQEFGLGVAADFFGWAQYLPTPGVKMVHRMRDELHRFVWEELESHKKSFDPDNARDFFDMLLLAQKEATNAENGESEKLTDTHLVLTVSNMFAAGIQTTTETLYWALAFMVEHRDVQSRVQAEIDNAIGRTRLPVVDDRGSLPYTVSTLYEVMRYSSILPIAVPHATTCDVNFRGYRIPKGAVVMLNTFSMHFDPKAWESPNEFKPEHFLEDDGALRKHTPSFLPFGAGRRSCLGEVAAKTDLIVIFTWLLQNYSFKKVPGQDSKSLLRIIENSAVGRNLENYELIMERRS
ncbi:steroid 17-alpha-hydroxylase/17,20 lyase-like [Lytechinus variegatus]|uniref:steroid 17-alpha-hydroxylase/17,20 lyase-like n=1 Tax=Lytechinus variegatus TaxID=7654 RepID=UPI001BB2306D|nr:steroid 17-alpha-hydroxylase/17,20 lyase-like [Lytechinus variegatus]XP_041485762.1 steroid 17-alpha-hydroxylase/17,20 lyase-like [Lytechinus variegatus]